MFSLLPMAALAAPGQTGNGYVARQEGLRAFFDVLSAPLGKPIILSKAAARRTITGEFSLEAPQKTLERIARQMGLIWYSDGQALYVYEASEAKSSVIALNTITVDKLTSFLRRSGLQDSRYPLRNDGLRTFYVAGPPIYVDLVVQAAQFMDNQSADLQLGQQRIGVIHLRNTFVGIVSTSCAMKVSRCLASQRPLKTCLKVSPEGLIQPSAIALGLGLG